MLYRLKLQHAGKLPGEVSFLGSDRVLRVLASHVTPSACNEALSFQVAEQTVERYFE